MKQFDKAILATCADCYKTQFVDADTARDAKKILKERHNWTLTLIGMVCENCSK
jgi:hypothetical protein